MMITLVGLGISPGDISISAFEKIRNAKKVLLRTALSTTGKDIIERGIEVTPLDFIYEKSRNFDTLAKNLAKQVIMASILDPVVYLVDGDVKDDASCQIILQKCKNVKVYPGVSKADYYLGKLGIGGSYCATSAYDLKDKRLSLPLVVYDVDSKFMASEVKLALADQFGDEIPCYKFINGTFTKIKLYESDFDDIYNYTSALVIDKLPLVEKTRFDFYDLHEIIKILRSENGCPWDRAQTKESIRKDILEEAYELVDAINRDDDDGMCEESGDLILQSVFSTIFAEENGTFSLNDVISDICIKLIQRHTHIFGTDTAASAENALDIWDKNKQKEKGFESATEYLESVPKNFPALMRAQKVGQRAKKHNMDFENLDQILDKINEEFEEVMTEINSGNSENLLNECGDLLFAVVSLARLLGINSEEALTLSTEKFIKRFKKTEELILKDGKVMKDLSPAEIDDYYNASKKN